MADSNPGDIIELTVDQSIGGVNVANVYHYQVQYEAASAADANQGLIEAFVNDVQNVLLGLLSPDLSIVCYTAKKIWPADETTDAWIDVVSEDGTLAGDALPPNKNYVMQFQADEPKKQTLGRKLFAGPLETGDTEGQIHSTTYSSWSALSSVLVGVITDATAQKNFSLGVFSKSIAKQLVANPAVQKTVWQPLIKAWLLPTVRQLRDRVSAVVLPTAGSSGFSVFKAPGETQGDALARLRLKHPTNEAFVR